MPNDTFAVAPTSFVKIPLHIWHDQRSNLRILFSEFGIQADTCRLVDNDTKFAFDTPLGWTSRIEEEFAVKLTEFM